MRSLHAQEQESQTNANIIVHIYLPKHKSITKSNLVEYKTYNIIRHFSTLGNVVLLEDGQADHLLGLLVIERVPLQVPHVRAVPGELLGVLVQLHNPPLRLLHYRKTSASKSVLIQSFFLKEPWLMLLQLAWDSTSRTCEMGTLCLHIHSWVRLIWCWSTWLASVGSSWKVSF